MQLHTDNQTSVVLVLAFTEVTSGPEPVDATNQAATPEGGLDDDRDESNLEGASQTTTVDPDSSSQTSSEEDTPTEQELLVASIDDATKPRTLAASFIDLHHRGQLA